MDHLIVFHSRSGPSGLIAWNKQAVASSETHHLNVSVKITVLWHSSSHISAIEESEHSSGNTPIHLSNSNDSTRFPFFVSGLKRLKIRHFKNLEFPIIHLDSTRAWFLTLICFPLFLSYHEFFILSKVEWLIFEIFLHCFAPHCCRNFFVTLDKINNLKI